MSAPATRVSGAPADLLRIADLSVAELKHLLALADAMKRYPDRWNGAFTGQSIACYFAKPSTRTRVSFEAAAARLGLVPIMLRPDELQLGRGEPITDTARVLSSYCAAIVIRTFAQDEVEAIAGAASVPVINALTDQHHPCQALADMLTLREHFGELSGLKLAYVGDGTNVAHSLMEACAGLGVDITIAGPREYWPDQQIRLETEVTAARHGVTVVVTDDPAEAVRGADAVYTDVWASMGSEGDADQRRAAFSPYRVTPQLMSLASRDAVFMHCLPAHRGEEVVADVIDGSQSIVFPQAANRLPTEQAVLYDLISGNGA